MPDITIPGWLLGGLNLILAFAGAFGVALWLSLIVWTFRDARARSRDAFAILLATIMVVIFGPLGLLIYFLLRPQVTLAELYERSLEEEALLQDLEERPRCPGCSRVVENHWIVCPDCHTQLKRICHNCNEKLNLRWNICPACGVGVNQAVNPQSAPNNSQPQKAAETAHSRYQPSPFSRPASAPAAVATDTEQASSWYTSETKPFRQPGATPKPVDHAADTTPADQE